MSSILKALRKIEEEKRGAKHAAPDLSVDQGRSSAKSGPYLPLLAGVALGATVVGLIFLLSANDIVSVVQGGSAAEQVRATAVASSPHEKSLGAEIKATDSTVTPDVPPAVVSYVQNHNRSIETVRAPEVSQHQQSASVIITHEDPLPQPATKPIVSKEQTVAVTTQQVVVPVKDAEAGQGPEDSQEIYTILPDGISLFVAEIFYQEDASDSMALVNDLPVMVGTHVESAIVDEIRPEQVLFRIAGKLYLVNVSSL
jgi:hypothetical protein